jgi:threonine/homoserine/homoserine lactone efflux protein
VVDVSWVLFLVASVAVILTPGQDMVLVMSRSIAQGALAGIATAAGVSSGLLLHTVLASLGVGAIVQTSELLFLAMKVVGAAYLVYLGISLLRMKSADLLTQSSNKRSYWKLYREGTISNIANPKVAIFYFAFLPQFVSPGATNPTLSIFILGASFALITFLIKGPIGYFSGQLSQWFLQKPQYLLSISRVSGLTLVSLGVKLAFEKQN